MKKIEGQAKGIQRMIEDGRYCVDILQQLTALTSAANEVAFLILQGHIEGCVSDAIRDGKGEEHIRELMDVLHRGMRR
jgi:DNA-binding FrmR family transcriptional regulator